MSNFKCKSIYGIKTYSCLLLLCNKNSAPLAGSTRSLFFGRDLFCGGHVHRALHQVSRPGQHVGEQHADVLVGRPAQSLCDLGTKLRQT